ncbi:hypothetical protein Pan241w_35560 [Gimesia alba]|uniref:Uncharacterized protein n=1 Tax=Gimesia alba TaxID=2527973 RepID=A0A517RHV0_9PLAN|nr:hypothetical protein [Gimesia alba]QDT43455.1 hypothetical protein Pan241w_35560 [Gimesia alba]
MSDWEERFQKLKQDNDAVLAAVKSEEQALSDAVALLPQQKVYAERIANEVVCDTLWRIDAILFDGGLNPVVTEHDSRMIGVVAEINNVRFAVNICSRLDGQTRITVFGGLKDTLGERIVDLDHDISDIQEWFADTIESYYKP